jgi:hypothetical protein
MTVVLLALLVQTFVDTLLASVQPLHTNHYGQSDEVIIIQTASYEAGEADCHEGFAHEEAWQAHQEEC